jgi:hypothetical protein
MKGQVGQVYLLIWGGKTIYLNPIITQFSFIDFIFLFIYILKNSDKKRELHMMGRSN